MGSYHSLYVGAYLELIDPPKGTALSDIPRCVKCGTGENSPFCPTCGSPTEKVMKEYTCGLYDLLPEGWDEGDALRTVYPEWGSDLESPVYVENGGTEYSDMDNPTVISPGDPEKHIARFKEAYSDLLEDLEGTGVDYVIKFGVISSWS